MNKLKSLPETEELTARTIDDAFREVASRFSKAVTVKAKETVAKTSQRKKDAAKIKAAAISKAGAQASNSVKEFREHTRSGNIADAMKMFFDGKVKFKG